MAEPLWALGSENAKAMLLSDRVGLIRSLHPVVTGVEEPFFPIMYRAALGGIPPGFRIWSGLGKGETVQESKTAAIAEALERYCGLCPDDREFVYGSLSDVGGLGVRPEELVLYSSKQYELNTIPYKKYGIHDSLSWQPAVELPSNVRRFVPASLTYLRTTKKTENDRLTNSTSNGMAAGKDLDSAILGGILELVERDSFLITWMQLLPTQRLLMSDLGTVEDRIVAHYKHFETDVIVYRLPTDIPVHVMMAVATNHSGRPPAIAIGLGCSLDPRDAVRKCLFELCQVRYCEMSRRRQPGANAPPQEPANVQRPSDHSGFFANGSSLNSLAFLDQATSVSLHELSSYSTGNPSTDVDLCVAQLRASGCRVLYIDITTPDLSRMEIRVVRVIITELQPLHFGYHRERLGGERLYTLPQKLGYCSVRRNEMDLNRVPHPLG
jgi:ribosomal protein S12 methylthiotransferase accessory factor